MTDTGGPLGPRRVTLGIGSIINEMDGTSESFSLWRYLKEHPLELDGRPVDVRLVSSVIDADLTVNGTVGGEQRYRYDQEPEGGMAGMIMLTIGAAVGIAGGTAGGALMTVETIAGDGGPLAFDQRKPFTIAVESAAVVGTVCLIALIHALVNLEVHRYTAESSTVLTLRRGSKVVTTIAAQNSLKTATAEPLPRLSDALSAPLWEKVREEIRRAAVTPGSQP
ncbi:MAG: hypothetical protein A2289_05855 [Deltaproteobacteria bacterium RIFOXYA12_FULL_58_15]|nr:MAG: hypothetical protein A2289_05855 [Deltaproteobacteria bacterium RIFOXYA12_FULL_58_15]